MLGSLMDRRGLAVSAALIISGIFAFLFATYPSWKAAISEVPLLDRTGPTSALQPAVALSPSPPMTSAATQSSPMQPSAAPSQPLAMQASASPAVPPVIEKAAPPVADNQPTFDIVRVEPTGEAVIAARGAPGANLVLLDEGKPIARAKADASGQVAFVPPTLTPGEHSLMLSIGEPGSPDALSSQSVAVSVPEQPKTAPMVALIEPNRPTQVLSGQVAGTPAAAPAKGPKLVEPSAVAIATIEMEEKGSFFASGKAAPGSHCRIYLNGSLVATVATGSDGAWSLQIKQGMRPGRYTVRADQVELASGSVQARAEVPFDYPGQSGAAISLLRPNTASKSGRASPTIKPVEVARAGQPTAVDGPTATASASGATKDGPAMASNTAGPADTSTVAPTVVAQLLTTKVVQGDSLWRISRKMLGHGVRYTQIYAANTQQIRDPRKIYPGQIFVMPETGMP